MAMELNPRVSLSRDLSSSPTFITSSSFRLDDDTGLPVDPPSAEEFDFSTSYEASSTPADLLFSQGKLLPLYNQAPNPPTKNICQDASCNKQQQLNIGRSSSVSSSKTPCQFPRSKSLSSSRRQDQVGRSSRLLWKSPSESSAKGAYYYCGDRRSLAYASGVRINPVINVPASFIPRGGSSSSSSTSTSGGGGGRSSRSSFFAYLLCNCTGKNMEISDSNGRRSVRCRVLKEE